MTKVTFITGNKNKVAYLSKTLGVPFEHYKLDLDEIQSADPRFVVEHKVRQAYGILKKPVLVEDTSLGFTALGGLPGPFIKFFIEQEDGLEKLCRMLDGLVDRSAYGSALYGYYDGARLEFFGGRVDGVIVAHPRGEGGYGWDSIFAPNGYGGRTRAKLPEKEELEVYDAIRDTAGLRAFLQKRS